MNELKPCPYRRASDDGQIMCDRIKAGDRAVSPNICRACPVAAINCAHLRTTLSHDARPPITVRWGNGKTQIWEADAPSIAMEHAACAAKVTPIHSPRDCAGCALRQPLVIANAIVATDTIPTAAKPQRRGATVPQPAVITAQSAPAPQANATQQPVVIAQAAVSQPAPDARANVVHQKIIQLQEWLKQNRTPAAPREREDEEPVMLTRIAVGGGRPMPTTRAEERRVGWTD
ncbi:MAG: hypothetical protein HY868_23285 [Chloroflexi bacterium]|nr:hypothetical protein [Chloroflexota bacterium]